MRRLLRTWGPSLFLMLNCCATSVPIPPGALVFGVLGDAPYTQAEIGRLDAVIDRINAEPLAFVVHVGDIGSSTPEQAWGGPRLPARQEKARGPPHSLPPPLHNAEPLAFVVHVGDIGSSTPEQACGDRWLEARKKQLARIRHPFLLIPGDNEWSDCQQPIERLKAWRTLFCNPNFPKMEQQAGEYCEHVRWEQGGWVFVALNVPGPDNHIRHPESEPRMRAVFAWLDEAAKLATNSKGLV